VAVCPEKVAVCGFSGGHFGGMFGGHAVPPPQPWFKLKAEKAHYSV